ncbi:MAG: tRNA preQ1(34) S-adenosylmethionine ribosyltransferase-isomerase QueA [Candidatus Omnitrophica bacterium]|nr:tRNA preQ1(34) S-adenosylmethionine ribosyltransferase-isomerase QueA [Candidatus Omnitrophota bacterium]MBL7151383.1 tRNA preQ1(34) S-adenosylmethionine ribosyltransferase-isomerase QueA [Candidatus Omnitrophota bacterium]MBL7210262.1 tRNA preQ1(34) S-adenosylmethionine ribosyltransferase-isomerase QueA [Candidatus Omnitrophota bacterium]
MHLSDFDYALPKELIAQYPLKERDSARLMVLDRSKESIRQGVFRDIVKFLKKGDLFVLNDTKVLRSRLNGRRASGGKAEILLLNRKEGLSFGALIKPARIKIGETLTFGKGQIQAVVSSKNEVTFRVDKPDTVYSVGVMPLPPYIKRDCEELDNHYYQTVYARHEGAVAAPTAGLHFTDELMQKMQSCGIKFAYITLHVGYATFKPVKEEDITRHKMEPECFKIPQSTIEALKEAKKNNSRIFAVGTTSLRALESYASGNREGYTDLFIYPGYKFRTVDCLLTNFHLPRTTLFMLASAFCGREFVKRAYARAVEEKYRFYSYGDAMLII